MPRTKLKAKPKVSEVNLKPTKAKLQQEGINCFLQAIDDEYKTRHLKLKAELEHLQLKLRNALTETCMKFPRADVNKTLAELANEMVEPISISDATSLRSVNASTKSVRKINNRTATTSKLEKTLTKVKRTSTFKKAKPPTRSSRSLSRSKLQHAAHSTLDAFTTPVNKTQYTSFGTVTPKLKPNTPQVLLRRPKQGEMALSMQGSPLMVGGVSSDALANVNIPLQDGRILTIQPQRGLRISEIPYLDEETRRQIETLRDNLNKVCAKPLC